MNQLYDFIGSKELAAILNLSVKTVRKHRGNIVGAVKIGHVWKFDLNKIKKAIDNKENIFQPKEGKQ